MTPLQIEKVNYILMQQCNIFHADMILVLLKTKH